MRCFLTLALSAAILSAGCFSEDALDSPRPVNPGAMGVDLEVPPETVAPDSVAVEEPEPETIKAEVGVGGKGDYGRGFISTPLSSFWAMQEKLAYEALVPHALNLYKGTNGHAPKSHEEFMKEIIEKERIKLPTLPDGHTYFYDAELEELRVRKPR